MAKIGYARVSTTEQNLERQFELLEHCERVFSDKYTGTKFDRKGFNDLLQFIRDGDIVVVTEMKRLGRNNSGITNAMNEIHRKGATIEILNLPTLANIQDDNLRRLLNIIIIEVFKYQAEQDLIEKKEVQRAGIEIAKKKGKYKGRRPIFKDGDERLQHAKELYSTGKMSLREVAKKTNINVTTLHRYLKKQVSSK